MMTTISEQQHGDVGVLARVEQCLFLSAPPKGRAYSTDIPWHCRLRDIEGGDTHLPTMWISIDGVFANIL